MFKSIGKSDNFNFNFYYPRQYEKAIEFAKITLDIDPNFFQAHRLLSLAYAGLEMFDEAIAENQRWGTELLIK
ncbi:MAG: hypothetical protein JJE22_02625 [Bacteroidia bacterium]|nr:hypothetical protein [Bacteroidia bacterium]